MPQIQKEKITIAVIGSKSVGKSNLISKIEISDKFNPYEITFDKRNEISEISTVAAVECTKYDFIYLLVDFSDEASDSSVIANLRAAEVKQSKRCKGRSHGLLLPRYASHRKDGVLIHR